MRSRPQRGRLRRRPGSAAPGLPTPQAPSNRDAAVTAVVLTVLAHILIFALAPRELGLTPRGAPDGEQRRSRTYEVELVPVPPAEAAEVLAQRVPPDAPEQRFVMAPSGVPEAVPEATFNISDRNQVAANPDKPDFLSDDQSPAVAGNLEESNRIVQGDPNRAPPTPPEAISPAAVAAYLRREAAPKPQPQLPPTPEAEEPRPASELARAAEKGTEDLGEGSLAGKIPEPGEAEKDPEKPVAPQLQLPQSRPNPEQTSPEDGQGREAQAIEAGQPMPPAPQAAPTPQPRPRLKVTSESSYGPIKQSRGGVVRIGNLAFNARYNDFGDYWRRSAEIIENRWRNLVYGSKAVVPSGGRVSIAFFINRDGTITDVRVKESTAGRLAETISLDSILSVSPLREWTPEMIATMEDKTECSLVFYY